MWMLKLIYINIYFCNDATKLEIEFDFILKLKKKK